MHDKEYTMFDLIIAYIPISVQSNNVVVVRLQLMHVYPFYKSICWGYSFELRGTVFDLITTHIRISVQSNNFVVIRLPLEFFYLFYKSIYYMGTHLNCHDKNYTVFDLITAHIPICVQSSNFVIFRL